MVTIVEGKDWKAIAEAIDSCSLSETHISTLGLTILDIDAITGMEDQMKSNIKKEIKNALGIE